MSNSVLERLRAQREEQVAFVDNLLAQVDARGDDMVPTERANLTAARERIGQLDDQIRPLEEFETLRAASTAGNPARGGARTEPRPMAAADAAPGVPWASAGAFIVDHLRARGVPWANQRPDEAAAQRIQRAAVQNEVLTDVPGLLPKPIVGGIVGALDASRPFVTSVGVKSMGGIPGQSFSRPRITQHTVAGKQAAPKTELASQQLRVSPVDFTKETYGGTVDVARQVIDWTSPAAWDALTQDLADVYGAQTEIAASASFAAAITQATDPVASDDLAGWTAALYQAAALSFLGGAAVGAVPLGKLPDKIWCSLDMWQKLGSIVETARLVTLPNPSGALGSGDVTTFAGEVLNLPRVVCWAFPPQTVILGSSAMFEFYEEIIGLLSAVEPSLLGVEVAYGGYVAYAPLDAMAFAKVTPPVVGP